MCGLSGRTRMKPLKYNGKDITAYIVLAAYFAVCIVTGRSF